MGSSELMANASSGFLVSRFELASSFVALGFTIICSFVDSEPTVEFALGLD